MDNSINITIQNIYDGPMELLLNLIKKDKIDIYDIPISYLTEEFLKTMGEISYKNVESFLEFSNMAATLLQIKSKMLLPLFDEEEDAEDPRESLVNRLIEYNYFKYISEVMLNYFDVGSKRLPKKAEDMTILAMAEEIDYKDIDIDKLSHVLSNLLRKNIVSKSILDFDIEEDLFTVEEGIVYLREKLEKLNKMNFSSLFGQKSTKLEIVTYFLAILELSKIRKIRVYQINEEDILIEKNNE